MSKIENLKKMLKEKQADYDSYEEEIIRIQQELISNNLYSNKTDILLTSVEQQVRDYTSIKKKSCDALVSAEVKAPLQATITSLTSDFPALTKLDATIVSEAAVKQDIYNLELAIEEAELAQKAPKGEEVIPSQQEEKLEQEAEVSQEGHVYPVKMVSAWTAKLRQYNKQLDDFIASVDALSVGVDVKWLCRKVESFCRKINFAIAMVRAEVVNALSAMYKQANSFTSLLDPIVNFNPVDIFACLSWVKNVISFFTKPYMIVIQFVIDFMTYTPPLVVEATKLVAKSATVPVHLACAIDFNTQDASDSNKEFADASKQYLNINAESISMGDIMGGGAATPKLEESQIDKTANDLLQKDVDTNKAKVTQALKDLRGYITNTPYNTSDDIYVTYPHKINKLAEATNSDYLSNNETAVSKSTTTFYTRDQVAEIIFPGQLGKKDVYNTSFNTIRHQYYIVYNVQKLKNMASEEASFTLVSDNLQSYYSLQYEGVKTKSDKKQFEFVSKEYNFILSFADVFPALPKYLKALQEAVYTYQAALDNQEAGLSV